MNRLQSKDNADFESSSNTSVTVASSSEFFSSPSTSLQGSEEEESSDDSMHDNSGECVVNNNKYDGKGNDVDDGREDGGRCVGSVVRFAKDDTIRYHPIGSRSDLSKKERNRYWWSGVERDKMKRKNEKLVDKYERLKYGLGDATGDNNKTEKKNALVSKKPSLPYHRGLENWTAAGSLKLEHGIRRCVDAVIDEQDRQWYVAFDDDAAAIAVFSERVTKENRNRALLNGLRDEKEALRVRALPWAKTCDIAGEDEDDDIDDNDSVPHPDLNLVHNSVSCSLSDAATVESITESTTAKTKREKTKIETRNANVLQSKGAIKTKKKKRSVSLTPPSARRRSGSSKTKSMTARGRGGRANIPDSFRMEKLPPKDGKKKKKNRGYSTTMKMTTISEKGCDPPGRIASLRVAKSTDEQERCAITTTTTTENQPLSSSSLLSELLCSPFDDEKDNNRKDSSFSTEENRPSSSSSSSFSLRCSASDDEKEIRESSSFSSARNMKKRCGSSSSSSFLRSTKSGGKSIRDMVRFHVVKPVVRNILIASQNRKTGKQQNNPFFFSLPSSSSG